MHSIGVLLQKTWIYGAAFWLLTHTSLRHRASLGLMLTILIGIEVAQCWLPGRSAGLTDPAIALLAAALLTLVDYRFTRPGDPVRQIPPEARSAVPLSNG
jgi:VanZ family protein